MTIRAAVFAFLDQQDKPRTFLPAFIEYMAMKYTNRDDVKRKHVMRCIREYCEISGATVRSVGHGYRFTPGVKVGKAIID